MTKPTGNKRGRTSTKALKSITENRSVGRPKGDAAIINEYKLRMLNSPKSAKVAGSGNMPQISINISGLNSPTLETVEDVLDVEVKD